MKRQTVLHAGLPKSGSRLRIIAAALLLLAGMAITRAIGTHPESAYGSQPAAHHGTGAVTALDMKSPSSGWGWGSAIVVHTVDGAAHLVDVTPAGVGIGRPIVSEAAIDARHAWIVARSSFGVGPFTVYRTADGGATWSSTNVGARQGGEITFVDALHGWMQATQLMNNHRVNVVTLSRTLDGGRTWSTIYRTRQRISIQPNVQKGDCQWSLVQFSTPSHGVAGLSCDRSGTLRVDLTNDGGKTWKRVSLPALRRPSGAAQFSIVQRPFLSGRDGAAVAGVCVSTGWQCHLYSALYRTTDGGRTWHPAPSIVRDGQSAVFADAQHAWLPDGCLRTCRPVPQILSTRDSGARWVSTALPRPLGPNMHGDQQFQFVSPSVGYAVVTAFGGNARYFRTVDGGRTFHGFQPHIVRQ